MPDQSNIRPLSVQHITMPEEAFPFVADGSASDGCCARHAGADGVEEESKAVSPRAVLAPYKDKTAPDVSGAAKGYAAFFRVISFLVEVLIASDAFLIEALAFFFSAFVFWGRNTPLGFGQQVGLAVVWNPEVLRKNEAQGEAG